MSGALPGQTERAEIPRQGPLRLDFSELGSISPSDYLVRFFFGFLISVVSAVVTDIAGPRVGGLFLAFPAILPATVTLVERKEGLAQAASDIRGAALGALGMIAFALVIAAEVEGSPSLAIIGALIAWVLASGVIYLVIRGLVHRLGEKQYLPEIPTSEAADVVSQLLARRLTIATAESCSGGMVAALLCSVPDASRVFRAGLVAYTDDLKMSLLGVPAPLLARNGAISAPVAAAMATGARQVSCADVGVAISGATGAGAEGKPPGLTFIAVATPDTRVRVRQFAEDLGPGRNDERAVRMALQIVRTVIAATDEPELPGTAAHADLRTNGEETLGERPR